MTGHFETCDNLRILTSVPLKNRFSSRILECLQNTLKLRIVRPFEEQDTYFVGAEHPLDVLAESDGVLTPSSEPYLASMQDSPEVSDCDVWE